MLKLNVRCLIAWNIQEAIDGDILALRKTYWCNAKDFAFHNIEDYEPNVVSCKASYFEIMHGSDSCMEIVYNRTLLP